MFEWWVEQNVIKAHICFQLRGKVMGMSWTISGLKIWVGDLRNYTRTLRKISTVNRNYLQ